MWHAARAQEKKLRGMVVDHKKRAERKRAWFSARTMDAFQMIRCHGSKVNLEINPLQREIVESGKNLVPWTANNDIFVDRFDGRVHLDFFKENNVSKYVDDPTGDKQYNFDRYRDLVAAKYYNLTPRAHLEKIEFELDNPTDSLKLISYELKTKKKNYESKSKVNTSSLTSKVENKSNIEKECEISAKEESIESLRERDYLISLLDELEDFSLGNVVAWNRHDRAQINKIGELFGIEDFIRHVEGELREKEEAKLKNNAASQFQFYDSSDLRSRLPRKERRRLKRKKSPTPRRRACSPLSYAKRASPSYNPYKSDGISDTTTDSEENSTAKQARVEFITEMTGTAQPVESSQPYYQEVEPYFRVTEKKREVDSSRSLSIRERMALKRQLALVKQLRQDQAKQQEKIDRKEDEMKLRRDGLRELGRKIQERRRKEQRRLRSDSFSSSMSRSRSRSRSRSKERRQSRARTLYRSLSRSSRSRSRSRSRSQSRFRGRKKSRRSKSRSPHAYSTYQRKS